MEQPLVSCIMPTANRHKYIPLALKGFFEQDYPNKELIIVDDGTAPVAALLPDDPRIRYTYHTVKATIGRKRNFACEQARGEIIMHWDDDDWHAPDWISRQLAELLASDADICGIEHVNFYSPLTDTFWQGTALNRNNPHYRGWLNGATLIYSRAFWSAHRFSELNTGEDDDFMQRSRAKLYAHDYIDGITVILHPGNTTVKYFENPVHKVNQGA